ncbi:MAG: TIGR02444 family protein [Mycobacterium sp.]
MRLPEFALAVHARDGVAEACVLLQDRFGVDVNVLLFAAQVGSTGTLTSAELDRAELDRASRQVADWHAEVIRPLRGVRRRLKSGPPPAPNATTTALREQLKGLELQAETIELDELSHLIPDHGISDDDPVARITAALLTAVRRTSSRELSSDEDDAVAAIAKAAARVGRENA